MVSTRSNRHVLWPIYFDNSLSRAEGRRVPKRIAMQDPTAQEIFNAVIGLGIQAALHEDKSHPSRWWAHEGCVSVEKTMRKTELIAKIAGEMIEARKKRQMN